MHFFNVIGGNGTETYKIRIYQKARFDMIKERMSFKFQNALKKTGNELWITSRSIIAYAASVETIEEIEVPNLPENAPQQGELKLLKDALQSPGKSEVTGEIFKVSPLKYRQEGSLAVKSIMIKDTSSVAKVCLFNKNALSRFNVGDTVKVTNDYPKVFQTRIQLITCPTSSLNLSDEDFCFANLDPDFSEELEKTPEEIVLINFTDVDVYVCCDNAVCTDDSHCFCPSGLVGKCYFNIFDRSYSCVCGIAMETTAIVLTTKTTTTTATHQTSGKPCPFCDTDLNCVWNQTCSDSETCMVRAVLEQGFKFSVHCIMSSDCQLMSTKFGEIFCCDDRGCLERYLPGV
uniref:Uncharacterized protein n=1 Tax=Magallana gigas TaxID=29159 RepID=A0A8W8NJL3_MAGGI